MPETAQDQIQKRAHESTNTAPNSELGKRIWARFQRRTQESSQSALQRIATEGRRSVPDSKKTALLSQIEPGTRANLVQSQIDAHSGILRGQYESFSDAKKKDWQDHIKRSLDESIMGDLFQGTTDQAQVKALTEGLLKDPQLMIIYHDQLDAIVGRKFTDFATVDVVKDKARLLRLTDPTKYPDDAAAETEAGKLLHVEWQDNIKDDLRSVFRTSLDVYMTENLKRVHEASQESTSSVAKGAQEKAKERWNQNSRKEGRKALKADWEAYKRFGGKAVLGEATWNSLSQQEQDDFNKDYGQFILSRGLYEGIVKKQDIGTLITSDFLGGNYQERVTKIEELMETNSQAKRILERGQQDGTFDKNMWDKIKAAGPVAGAGMIAALLAYLALPVTAIPAALWAAGGAAAGGGAKLGTDYLKDNF